MPKVVTLPDLDEYEQKVLGSFDEGYEYLVLIIPGRAGINGVENTDQGVSEFAGPEMGNGGSPVPRPPRSKPSTGIAR